MAASIFVLILDCRWCAAFDGSTCRKWSQALSAQYNSSRVTGAGVKLEAATVAIQSWPAAIVVLQIQKPRNSQVGGPIDALEMQLRETPPPMGQR